MGINRTVRPGSSATNQAAGPVSPGETVPSTPGAGSGWSPTVANLLVLIVLEVVAFAAIRYAFHIVQK